MHSNLKLKRGTAREIYSTEFKAARYLASGANLKERSGAAHFLYSGIRVMLKAEDFLSVGVRNHPALTAAMLRFWSVLEALGPPTSNLVLAPGILSSLAVVL